MTAKSNLTTKSLNVECGQSAGAIYTCGRIRGQVTRAWEFGSGVDSLGCPVDLFEQSGLRCTRSVEDKEAFIYLRFRDSELLLLLDY